MMKLTIDFELDESFFIELLAEIINNDFQDSLQSYVYTCLSEDIFKKYNISEDMYNQIKEELIKFITNKLNNLKIER